MSKEREIARALIERAHANADCAEDDLVAALMAARKAALEEAAKDMDERAAFYLKHGRVGRSEDFAQAAGAIRALAQGGGK